MVFSIKINNSEDGKVCIDGKKANAKAFSDYIKESYEKPVVSPGYKIIIYHYGNPYTIDGNLLASKSEFVLSLIKLFKSPLQLDFSDCSRNGIERVINFLKTGDDNFDPLELSSVYDVVVKLDIKDLRMALKRRIDNAIVGLNVEKQLRRIQSRSRSRVQNKKKSLNDYKKCFDEVYELLKAIDKFNGFIQAVPVDEEPRRGRSTKRGTDKEKRISLTRSTGNKRGKSTDKSIPRYFNSNKRGLSNTSRKDRSVSRQHKNNSSINKDISQEKYRQPSKVEKKKNIPRDLSQLSGNGKRNVMKEESKKGPKSKRRNRNKGKKSQGKLINDLSPYKKEVIDNGIITITPYFNQNNIIRNEESIPPSSFTTDSSENSTALSIEDDGKKNSKKNRYFNNSQDKNYSYECRDGPNPRNNMFYDIN
uniref:BTB domain-containing protein n=1 Tax=Strongyloides stercoralis TaxID=6248 RepID=A0A0K0EHM6_STRER